MTGARWTEIFLEAIQAEHNAAENTVLAYHRDLEKFTGYLADRARDPATADRDDIESYLVMLTAEGMSAATRARHLSAIRQFYRFAFEEGWRGDNPAARVKSPTARKQLPATLGDARTTPWAAGIRASTRSASPPM